MKNKKVIIILTTVSIIILLAIFAIAIYEVKKQENQQNIIGTKIIEPDRMVYRTEDGKYYEFNAGEEEYEQLKMQLNKSITKYKNQGITLTNEEINEIHKKSFIEFDYKTASKNYIIQLEENENQAVIKLSETGGTVCLEKIKGLNKIKQILENSIQEKSSYELNYKEYYSKNSLQTMDYQYLQQLKEINYKIHQIKVTNIEDYKKHSETCKILIDEEINEETFNNNDVIITISLEPKIETKVNIGNIKYTYNNQLNNMNNYYVHVLIVSKIVNTDCIYNTDMAELESKVELDNFRAKYDEAVENIDENVFMTDYNEFIKQYENATTTITKQEAEEIAEKGFKEAERICGAYEKSTQKSTEIQVWPNNFFTRKNNEYDQTYSTKVEVYAFTRVDDMELNGVAIYVDKRLGKIVAGGAFGD